MENLYDKVIWAKGRIWTIYGTNETGETGVWCYQGLKPFSSYKFDSSRRNHGRNINYFHLKDCVFLETELEQQQKLEEMETEDKKKLNKTKAIEFFMYLTGHSKTFVSKNIHQEKRYSGNAFEFNPGFVRYSIWKSEGCIYLHQLLGNESWDSSYFDFITFETQDRLNDLKREKERNEIIEDYKSWKGIE
jgi:hypothetical protein